jgi:hypothetical protein
MTTDATPPRDEPHAVSRRGLLRTGGLTVGVAALLAACKKEEAAAPGRVGFAPVPTDLPQQSVTDGVRLRTATSIEYTILDVYATITESGKLAAPEQQLVDRLVADHKQAAAQLAELTESAGAEPYECANSWYMDRVIPPIFTAIDGDEATGVPPSDDPARDMLATVNAMEAMAGAMYQGMVETLSEPELRAQVMMIGAVSARHAAVSALHANPPPKGYVSPVVLGQEAPAADKGLNPLFAIPTEFGALAPTQLTIGAPSAAGTRTTMPIDTPAENSFVYTGQTCPTT